MDLKDEMDNMLDQLGGCYSSVRNLNKLLQRLKQVEAITLQDANRRHKLAIRWPNDTDRCVAPDKRRLGGYNHPISLKFFFEISASYILRTAYRWERKVERRRPFSWERMDCFFF